jgi:pimeloyl-ACP methyl ester carboxylesterase
MTGRRWGTGPQHAVLLHGSTSSSATWWRAGPALAARGWSVTAPDLPGHGGGLAPGVPLLPGTAADVVRSQLGADPVDLLVGHSFGAAVALLLLDRGPARVVLEELPGRASVDWAAEAAAVRTGAAEARADPDGTLARTRAAQRRWADEDCRHAVHDLARCAADDVAGGLARGGDWPRAEPVDVPVLLLLAPDAPGRNHLSDATALRGPDRTRAQATLAADLRVLDTGHCVHRDDPAGWLDAVTGWAG